MARWRYMKREAVLCGRGRKGAIHISGSVRRGSPSGGGGKACLPSGGLQNPSLHVNKIPGQKQKEHDSEKRPLSVIFTVYHPRCSPLPSPSVSSSGNKRSTSCKKSFPLLLREGGREGRRGSREGERQMGMRRARWRRWSVGGTRKRRERKVESHRAGRGGRAEANNVSGLPQCSQSGRRPAASAMPLVAAESAGRNTMDEVCTPISRFLAPLLRA